jgi:mono/diheme cytochrome c family protein
VVQRSWYAWVLLVVIGTIAVASGQQQTPPHATPLETVMRGKAVAVEQLLVPVVMADFVGIQRELGRLRPLTKAAMAAWETNPDDRYLQQATALVQGIQEMREGVRMRDADRVSIGYAAMISACVQCHQLRRPVRGRAPRPPL